MKVKLFFIPLIAALTFSACQNNNQEVKNLNNNRDSVSYAIGMNLGHSFKSQKLDLNLKALYSGMNDAVYDSTYLLSKREAQRVVMAYQRKIMLKRNTERITEAATNEKEGKEFLKANKNKPGVITTPSGLQYIVLKKGNGPKPKMTDKVTVNYKGTFINGKVFDSSYKRRKPATLSVNGVIKGWTEALKMMRAGSKWKLFVPSNLAYGTRGSGPIPPNKTLIFEIELLSIKK